MTFPWPIPAYSPRVYDQNLITNEWLNINFACEKLNKLFINGMFIRLAEDVCEHRPGIPWITQFCKRICKLIDTNYNYTNCEHKERRVLDMCSSNCVEPALYACVCYLYLLDKVIRDGYFNRLNVNGLHESVFGWFFWYRKAISIAKI